LTLGSLRRTGGVGVSGVSAVSPLLELLLELELELLSGLGLLGASPGMSGAAPVGNGCSVEADGLGALGAAGTAGVLVSPGNGNCRVGAGAAGGCCEEGAEVQGVAAGWSAGQGAELGVEVVWPRQAAVERAAAASKSRIEVRSDIS